jgi:hypothetical protein
MNARALRAVFFGSLLIAAAAFAYGRRKEHQEEPAFPILPEGIRKATRSAAAEQWIREGYIEMVAPVRPPSSLDGKTRIAVYTRFPKGGLVRAVPGREPGTWTLEVPDGTESDRVELYGEGEADADVSNGNFRVLDVRGIRFQEGGQEMHVLRPAANTRALLGLAWQRGPLEANATALLSDLVRNAVLTAPNTQAEREKAATHLSAIKNCQTCHVPQHAARTRESEPGIVNRGTDASGLFQHASILQERLPFETYRPRDMNLNDKYITRFCSGTLALVGTQRCPDGSIVEGQLDIKAALAAGDLHAKRVCDSRRALAERMSPEARTRFSIAFEVCGIAL